MRALRPEIVGVMPLARPCATEEKTVTSMTSRLVEKMKFHKRIIGPVAIDNSHSGGLGTGGGGGKLKFRLKLVERGPWGGEPEEGKFSVVPYCGA